MSEVLRLIPSKTNYKEISNLVEEKYNNFTEDSKLEMKIGIIMEKTINNIKQCDNDIKNDLEEIKHKLFSESNNKNKNLLMLNIEEEVRKPEFNNFVVEKLNKEGKLNNLFQQKKKNEDLINNNKNKIKHDEAFLYEAFYCILCHLKPRCILTDCNHLVLCEDCIGKTKICTKCGNNINKYQKIYRS